MSQCQLLGLSLMVLQMYYVSTNICSILSMWKWKVWKWHVKFKYISCIQSYYTGSCQRKELF